MNLNLEEASTTSDSFQPSSFLRRLGAIFYDSILLFCIVFIAWQPVPLLPEDLPAFLSRSLRLFYLLIICFVYFGWSWRKGGQTVGMKAWRIKLISSSATSSESLSSITWRTAWTRFVVAMVSWTIFGLGFLTSLFHKRKLTWHDIASETRLVVIKKSR